MPNKMDIKINTDAIKNTVMNYIVPLISFGVSAALILLVIYPSTQKVPQLNNDLRTKITLRTSLEAKVLALSKLTDYKSVLEEDLALMDKVLVTEDNVPYLLNQIDQISRNVGLTIGRLSYGVGGTSEVGSETQGTQMDYVAVNLAVTGSYDQTISFLKNVEKAARIIDVSNVRYSTTNKVDESELLSLSYLIYSPYLKVNSNATTDDAIDLDLTNPEFIKIMNRIKDFTFYENMIPSFTIKAEEKPISEIEAPVVEPTPEETTNSVNPL